MQEIPGKNADENFNQRDRYSRPDRDQTRRQRQSHPNRGDKPDVLKNSARTETDPNRIEHNKTPVRALLRQQESLALKPVRRLSHFEKGKLHCPHGQYRHSNLEQLHLEAFSEVEMAADRVVVGAIIRDLAI